MPSTDSKSTSHKKQTQVRQIPPHTPTYSQQTEDNTIDFYELWRTLYDKKWLVIAVIVISTLGSVVYALNQPSVYKAKTLLLPPDAKDLRSLKMASTLGSVPGMPTINTNSVFEKFKTNLNSRLVQKKFILENGLIDLLAPDRTPETPDSEIHAEFEKLLQIGNAREGTSLSLELHDAEIASNWVNNFVKFVDIITISMLVENIRTAIENEISQIEYKIASKRHMKKKRMEDQREELERAIKFKRQMATSRRKDKIKRYEEAAKTAKALGVKAGLTQQTKTVKNTSETIDSLKSSESVAQTPLGQVNVDIATATTPLFFIGYDALYAELDNLKSRTNDDPFIPGLRDLQEQLSVLGYMESPDRFIDGLRSMQERITLLRSVKIEEEKLKSVYVDEVAYPTKVRIRPNRRIFVSLGAFVGLFSGIFLAFLVAFVQKQKEIHSA